MSDCLEDCLRVDLEPEFPDRVLAKFLSGRGHLIDIRYAMLLATFYTDVTKRFTQAYYYVPESNTLLNRKASDDGNQKWREATVDELLSEFERVGDSPTTDVRMYLGSVQPSVMFKEDDDGTVFKIIAIPIPDLSLMTQGLTSSSTLPTDTAMTPTTDDVFQPKAAPSRKKGNRRENSVQFRALEVLSNNPELTNVAIARIVGCRPSTLSNERLCPAFIKQRAIYKADREKYQRDSILDD